MDNISHKLNNNCIFFHVDMLLVCSVKTIAMQTIQLPFLNNTIEIDPEQIKEFRKNGHTLICNIISAEELAP